MFRLEIISRSFFKVTEQSVTKIYRTSGNFVNYFKLCFIKSSFIKKLKTKNPRCARIEPC